MIWVGDFFGDLLEDGKLKKAYELDGTHLSPNYIPLLVNELDRAIRIKSQMMGIVKMFICVRVCVCLYTIHCDYNDDFK